MFHIQSILRSLRSLRSVVLVAAAATPAVADPQTDLVTPTAWRWRANAPLSSIETDINAGYRLVDIEVESVGPLRLSAVLVRNTGDYAKTWFWYRGQTGAEVTSRLTQHDARLIDIEPYMTPNGIRFAIVLVRNTGSDFAQAHGWLNGRTFTQLTTWINNNPGRRIIDVQPFRNAAGNLRYVAAWVQNSGHHHQPSWGILLNTTQSVIQNHLAGGNRRLIDLEVEDDTGRMSCLTVPADGNQWYWFTNVPFGDVQTLCGQYASRPIDLQRYRTPSGVVRYAMVVRRNRDDLTVLANSRQRAQLPISARSGFLLREYQGAPSTLATVFGNRTFEPASTLKMAHHFTAMRRVANGQDSLTANVIERTGLNGSCPTGTNPTTRQLRAVLRDMMEQSSNTATEAIRARYGTSTIESTCASFGASSVALNHTLGCLCGQTRNEVSLNHLAALQEAVIGGALGNFRDDYYDLMSNGTNFGRGSFSTTTVLDQELASSSLTSEEEAAFRAGLLFAHKGGSYTCNSAGGSEQHRSRAAYVRIPFRSGCTTELREFFIGAWVNDATSGGSANDAVGVAITTLYRDRLRAAIQSWESAACNAFQTYCTSNPNSTGQIARCLATGNPFVALNDLRIRADRLPQGSFGSLIVSRTAGFAANPGGSAGNLCVGGQIGRFGDSIRNSGTTGTFSYDVDLTSIPTPFGTTFAIGSGEPLHFQWWYRDTTPAGPPTWNYTNGLRVRFI